jgi:hypothetical protein
LAKYSWSALGIGSGHIPIMLAAIAMGGHVRVGMEDNVYYAKNRLAKSNAEPVPGQSVSFAMPTRKQPALRKHGVSLELTGNSRKNNRVRLRKRRRTHCSAPFFVYKPILPNQGVKYSISAHNNWEKLHQL